MLHMVLVNSDAMFVKYSCRTMLKPVLEMTDSGLAGAVICSGS